MGGRAVVDGGDGLVRAAHFETTLAQPVEGLGRGDFMHQVQVNVQARLARRVAGRRHAGPRFFQRVFLMPYLKRPAAGIVAWFVKRFMPVGQGLAGALS